MASDLREDAKNIYMNAFLHILDGNIQVLSFELHFMYYILNLQFRVTEEN